MIGDRLRAAEDKLRGGVSAVGVVSSRLRHIGSCDGVVCMCVTRI